MNVKEFVEKFEKARDKEKFVSEHVIVDYIPYEEKISACKNIIDICMYKEVNGEKIFRYNTPTRYVLFVLKMVQLYTDIELSSENPIADFNDLNRVHLFDKIASELGDEYLDFNSVMKMVYDDTVSTEESVVFNLNSKLKVFLGLIDRMVAIADEKQ